MDVLEKAKILGKAGKYDSCGPKMCEVNVENSLGGVYHAKAEHKNCRIFKTLMNNECSFDCKYCANSGHKSKKNVKYEPKELAKVFMHLHRKLAVNGLFLSSGVAGDPDKVTEEMLKAVKLIRYHHNFKGYVHFKVLPGTSYELVRQASELSNRMSINIEAPSRDVLHELSSCKDYKIDIIKRQAWISKMGLRSGQATQMIVNRLSTDKDILKMVDWEYKALDLRRIYFSAFAPIKGTPLENEKPESLSRQNRLYNSDFLLREYDFKVKELKSIMDDGMLPREDPKLALAKANFEGALDINEASYEQLIRIPGIGPKTARRILYSKKISSYYDLHKLGGWVKRAKPFIEVNGKRQTRLIDF